MPRRSLRPHLNQVRTWVRQGRTDAWIAHQLEVTVQQIESFKREQGLAPESEETDGAPAGGDFDEEIDLRAEDDALIAAELEAAEASAAEEEEASEGDDDSEEGESDGDDDAARAAAGADAGGDAVVAAAAGAASRSRAPSTTARRATGCGSTPPCRTTPSTPSTGPDTGRSW